jgi:hypothetical protein
MKRSKFSEEQIVYAIRQAEAGTTVGDLCRQLGVSDATFYAWKKKYARKLPRQGDSFNGELLASDVGPIPRRFLTSTDGFLGGLDHLTLSNKLIRRQVPSEL